MKKLCITLAVIMLAACSKSDYVLGSFYYGGSYPDEESQAAASGDRFGEIVENPFIPVADNPQSTFSVDADGASYAYMRRMVESGRLPAANSVRIEEFLNYFTFDYPDPENGDIALNAECGPCPWNSAHKLLRLGIKGKSLPQDEIPQANFVFLIDISGSMSSMDKLPLLKQGLISMLDRMRPDDRVSIVTYASGEELILRSTPVSEKEAIVSAIRKLSAGGATAGANAMKMAYEEALASFIEGGNNRVVMGTDGDFNVGVTRTDALLEMVQNYASRGVYLTICGFGTGNLNDSMMETVSNGGNGTYHYIDSELEMTKVFVTESARFVTIANDCKTQITFNPEAVSSYRLIGYENRVMSNEDFTNDKADAAEIGMGQTITALYELEPAQNASGSIGNFAFRYKKTLDGDSIPMSLEIPEPVSTMSGNLRFAASLAAFGLTLRDSKYKGEASIGMAAELAAGNTADDSFRIQYAELLDKAASITSK